MYRIVFIIIIIIIIFIIFIIIIIIIIIIIMFSCTQTIPEANPDVVTGVVLSQFSHQVGLDWELFFYFQTTVHMTREAFSNPALAKPN